MKEQNVPHEATYVSSEDSETETTVFLSTVQFESLMANVNFLAALVELKEKSPGITINQAFETARENSVG